MLLSGYHQNTSIPVYQTRDGIKTDASWILLAFDLPANRGAFVIVSRSQKSLHFAIFMLFADCVL